jgi:hypothetical protein
VLYNAIQFTSLNSCAGTTAIRLTTERERERERENSNIKSTQIIRSENTCQIDIKK